MSRGRAPARTLALAAGSAYSPWPPPIDLRARQLWITNQTPRFLHALDLECHTIGRVLKGTAAGGIDRPGNYRPVTRDRLGHKLGHGSADLYFLHPRFLVVVEGPTNLRIMHIHEKPLLAFDRLAAREADQTGN